MGVGKCYGIINRIAQYNSTQKEKALVIVSINLLLNVEITQTTEEEAIVVVAQKKDRQGIKTISDTIKCVG